MRLDATATATAADSATAEPQRLSSCCCLCFCSCCCWENRTFILPTKRRYYLAKQPNSQPASHSVDIRLFVLTIPSSSCYCYGWFFFLLLLVVLLLLEIFVWCSMLRLFVVGIVVVMFTMPYILSRVE